MFKVLWVTLVAEAFLHYFSLEPSSARSRKCIILILFNIKLVRFAICILCAVNMVNKGSALLQEIRSKCDVWNWWSPTRRRMFLTMMTMTMMMKITAEREDLLLQWVESWSTTSSHRPIRSVGLTMWLLKTRFNSCGTGHLSKSGGLGSFSFQYKF